MINAPSAPGRHCKNRQSEWTMTGAILFVGILQLVWPDALEAGKFQFILNVISPKVFALFCFVTGWLRMVALFLNGNWPMYSALVRAAGATAGTVVLVELMVSIIMLQVEIGGPPSLIVPFLGMWIGSEICSAYRAASDARYR